MYRTRLETQNFELNLAGLNWIFKLYRAEPDKVTVLKPSSELNTTENEMFLNQHILFHFRNKLKITLFTFIRTVPNWNWCFPWTRTGPISIKIYFISTSPSRSVNFTKRAPLDHCAVRYRPNRNRRDRVSTARSRPPGFHCDVCVSVPVGNSVLNRRGLPSIWFDDVR